MSTRTIAVDENGQSEVISINEDDDAEVGSYGCNLEEGDEVELEDGSYWTVDSVGSRIQTGNPGCGDSNFVWVELTENDEDNV
jgi:hypothetical protein